MGIIFSMRGVLRGGAWGGWGGESSKTGRRPLLGPQARIVRALSQKKGTPSIHAPGNTRGAKPSTKRPGGPRRGMIVGRRASYAHQYPTGRRANAEGPRPARIVRSFPGVRSADGYANPTEGAPRGRGAREGPRGAGGGPQGAREGPQRAKARPRGARTERRGAPREGERDGGEGGPNPATSGRGGIWA